MSDKSAIEWTGATWSPVYGCTKVDPACARCYIERTIPYRTRGLKFVDGRIPVQLFPERLDVKKVRRLKPLDRPIFVCSLSDLFHDDVPDDYLGRVFDVIAACPERTFQVLTKRIERAGDFLPSLAGWPFPNVWVGTTIGNARWTWRADVLREIPSAVRFISAEPLLDSLFPPDRAARAEHADGETHGGIGAGTGLAAAAAAGPGRDDNHVTSPKRAPLDLTGIDWLIVGGESGPGARPMQPEWVRDLRDACLGLEQQVCCGQYRMACCGNYLRTGECCGNGEPECCGDPDRTPRPAFFFKQWGGRTPKSGGRLLDGREWNEMPPSSLLMEGSA